MWKTFLTRLYWFRCKIFYLKWKFLEIDYRKEASPDCGVCKFKCWLWHLGEPAGYSGGAISWGNEFLCYSGGFIRGEVAGVEGSLWGNWWSMSWANSARTLALTEVTALAGEGQKIFMVAIPALHPGKAMVQVATVKKEQYKKMVPSLSS